MVLEKCQNISDLVNDLANSIVIGPIIHVAEDL